MKLSLRLAAGPLVCELALQLDQSPPAMIGRPAEDHLLDESDVLYVVAGGEDEALVDFLLDELYPTQEAMDS